MRKKLFIWLQYILPQHLLSRLMGYIAECRWKWVKNFIITHFIQHYQINLSICLSSDITDYPTFNAFFTRALKSTARPISPAASAVISPVDGCIAQIGTLENSRLLQAKGTYFTVDAFLGGSHHRFYDGHFATFYLSPKDYHRVHMPLNGKLRKTIYVPGKLFSVNTLATENIPQLFSRNERLICHFDTAAGPMAVILIGAMMVGKIETIWGLKERSNHLVTRHYIDQENIFLTKGAELGRFNMGSSVIILFEKNHIKWQADLTSQSSIQMGETIAVHL